jgi:transcriptional regulator with XRE-family HTH domain
MSPDDPRHGTTAGHYQHRKEGEEACQPCVAAKTRYEKIRTVYGNRMIPAIGTRRRVRALKAMGHSGAEIGARLGITYQAVNKIEHGSSDQIRVATAKKVRRVYEELCMTIPTGYHRTRIRNASARMGYAPPLAWNNIDDPNEVPRNWQRSTDDWIAELYDLDDNQFGITAVLARLAVTRKSLQKRCERHGLMPLYSRFVAREQPHYWANQYGDGAA